MQFLGMRSDTKHVSRTAVIALAISGCSIFSPLAIAEDAIDNDVQATDVGLIELEHEIKERPDAMSGLFKSDTHATLRKVVDLIHTQIDDDQNDTLVLRLRGVQLGLTQVEEIGAEIAQYRAAGKKVHIFSEFYETPELLLASYADDVLMQAGGPISLPGIYSEEMYLADTLAWAGIKAELIQVGDYKGANEQFVNSAPSPAWSRNIDSLLDSLYANIRTRLKQGRHLSDAQLDDAMRKAWLATDQTGIQTGLVDRAMDLPELNAHLKQQYKTDIAWTNILKFDDDETMNVSNPFQIFAQLGAKQYKGPRRDTIAVVHIDGPIIDGNSTSGGFGGETQVGSWTIRRTLGELEENDKIKGIILRINSPGGSAIASEIMWQGVRRVAEKKPVWVSVGSMAASGGYYLAVAGDKIYVNPSSIVGSIGVVGGKMSLSGVYDNLRIRTYSRSRGPMGGILSSSLPWTSAERATVREKMVETYNLFTKRVIQGRKDIDLSKTAEGRLFTGSDAVGLNMADKIGGLNVAITDLATDLGLEENQYDIIDYPEPKSFADVLGEMLGGMAMAQNGQANPNQTRGFVLGALREVVGEDAWPQVRDSLGALMQLRKEPVILASPNVLIFRRR